MIPQITVEKSKENKAPGEGDLTDSSHADQLIEEESFKDTLPLNIVTGFEGKERALEKLLRSFRQMGSVLRISSLLLLGGVFWHIL